MSQKRVAIIGAGASGLICARECLREGLEVQIFEKFAYSGGMWVANKVPKDLQELNVCENKYTEIASKVHTSIYDNLQTNGSRYVMGLTDFPFDTEFPGCKDTRLFPGHDEVSRYLDAFKEKYDLEKYISYETEVVKVTRIENSEIEWQVKFQSKGEVRSSLFDIVAVCSGHYTVPRLPDLKKVEGFGRPCLHSHLYRNPDRYRDKVVLVLGNKVSGTEIALDIANEAKKLYICGRRWAKGSDLSKPFGSKPNISLCADISHCPTEGTVKLVDGTLLTNIDEMLFCTGYAYDFPFLKNSELISISESFVYPIYKHIFHAKHPTLGFIGMAGFSLAFITFECQAKYFVEVVTGKCQLPDYDKMIKDIELKRQEVEEKNLDLRYFHDLGNDLFLYMNELLSLCSDCSELPTWRRDAFFFHFPLIAKEPHLFRTFELPSEIVNRAKEEFDCVRKTKQQRG